MVLVLFMLTVGLLRLSLIVLLRVDFVISLIAVVIVVVVSCGADGSSVVVVADKAE